MRLYGRSFVKQLSSKSDSELEGLAVAASIFDQDARLALFERHFVSRKGALEKLIRDRFSADFEEKFNTMAGRY